MRGKAPLILLVIAAFVVAGGSAVVLRAMSGGGGTGDTARLVPADAPVYATVNTDAASRQWVQLAQLLTRLGVGDDSRTARDQGLLAAKLDWEKDIAPYLGGEATLALTSVDKAQPEGVVILSVTDGDKAWQHATAKLDELAKDGDGQPENSSYHGVTVRTYPAGGNGTPLALAHKGRYLIGGSSADQVQSVLDLEAGKGEPLAGSKRFHDARAAVNSDPLIFVYVNPAALGPASSTFTSLAGLGDPSMNAALRSAGLENAAFGFAVTAETNGVRFEWQTVGINTANSAVALRQAPDQSRFARRAAADTLLYVAGADLYDSYVKGVRQALDRYGKSAGGAQAASAFDDGLNQLSQELGFDIEKGLLAHLTGEYAFALGAPAASTEAIWALGMTAVDDPAATQPALTKIGAYLDKLGLSPTTSKAGAATVTTIQSPDSADQAVAYTLTGDELLVGYGKHTLANALAQTNALADDADFKEAEALLPKGHALAAFVNLKRAVALAKDASAGDRSVPWQALAHLRFVVASVTQAADHAGGLVFLRVD